MLCHDRIRSRTNDRGRRCRGERNRSPHALETAFRVSARMRVCCLILLCGLAPPAQARAPFSGEKKLNNLVSTLLEASTLSRSPHGLIFTRPREGWVLVALKCQGKGRVRVVLDKPLRGGAVLLDGVEGSPRLEAMRWVATGAHTLQVECRGKLRVERLSVRAIPELMHCGLGFDPAIKSYGKYDLRFLKPDILPNVTTLIVPNNIHLPKPVIADWHRQGKKFVAEVGISSEAKTAEDHARYWTNYFDKAPFLDGILINEFIVNRPVIEWAELTPERLARMQQERERYQVYGEAIQRLRADARLKDKVIYAYVGGSGKKLNTEIIGTRFIPTILGCDYRVALERYLHEMSSEKGSRDALQTFVDGIGDWEANAPGVTKQMVIAFGLFSMPPGGLNKQPNVDYHVWMDQQMNVVANNPAFTHLAGLEWWTSGLADEETVRFVGRLYRHYALEGKTGLLIKDPLFLTHLQNPDFARGAEGWTLHPAEPGRITAKRFPRYGRIEGRFMGLGRPADPEHIGDTFLCLKRSANGPNIVSQILKDLQPGKLYSLKMFTCDYDDLVHPKVRRPEDVQPMGTVTVEGVDLDVKRSFAEVYASGPEPNIPVCITYHWQVFRARARTATVKISDWRNQKEPGGATGQELTFNFVEVEPYHE